MDWESSQAGEDIVIRAAARSGPKSGRARESSDGRSPFDALSATVRAVQRCTSQDRPGAGRSALLPDPVGRFRPLIKGPFIRQQFVATKSLVVRAAGIEPARSFLLRIFLPSTAFAADTRRSMLSPSTKDGRDHPHFAGENSASMTIVVRIGLVFSECLSL